MLNQNWFLDYRHCFVQTFLISDFYPIEILSFSFLLNCTFVWEINLKDSFNCFRSAG